VIKMLIRLIRDDRGSNALEYGLIVGLISLAIVAGAGATGTALGNIFNAVSTQVQTAASRLTT